MNNLEGNWNEMKMKTLSIIYRYISDYILHLLTRHINIVIKQNIWYWSSENPYWFHERIVLLVDIFLKISKN